MNITDKKLYNTLQVLTDIKYFIKKEYWGDLEEVIFHLTGMISDLNTILKIEEILKETLFLKYLIEIKNTPEALVKVEKITNEIHNIVIIRKGNDK